MSSHHFMVQPYRDVTNSGPMMIALNYALPLIAPDIGCFRDVYDQHSAFLYPTEELKSALRKAATLTPTAYQKMHEAAIKVRNANTEECIAENYIKLFKEIAH